MIDFQAMPDENRDHGCMLVLTLMIFGGLGIALLGVLSNVAEERAPSAALEVSPPARQPSSRVRRIQELIRSRTNPLIELSSVHVIQQSKDVVVSGKGRNAGGCILASLHARARLKDQVDGILVEVGGDPAFEVNAGTEFSFKFYFYNTRKTDAVRLWFALDDLEDDDFENDPVVPFRVHRSRPVQYTILR